MVHPEAPCRRRPPAAHGPHRVPSSGGLAPRVVEQLAGLGYEPALTPDATHGAGAVDQAAAVTAARCGRIRLRQHHAVSVPHYADRAVRSTWLPADLLWTEPRLCAAGAAVQRVDYFRTAWRAVRTRTMAVEVPERARPRGAVRPQPRRHRVRRGPLHGSFAGLVFFLLIGRLFQHKVFGTRVRYAPSDRPAASGEGGAESGRRRSGADRRLQIGDRRRMRRHEVVPADAVLLEDAAQVDYAFVTGEQTPVLLRAGETVRAQGPRPGIGRCGCACSKKRPTASSRNSGASRSMGARRDAG